MNQFERWLQQKRIRPQRFYGICLTLSLIGIIAISYLVLRHSDSDHIVLIEDAEIRTGPNAAYPVLYAIHQGDEFVQIGKSGKWIQVRSTNGKQKGWIAGWHTNLDIPADENPRANPLKNKTVIIDPGHGGADQGASSQTGKKTLEKDITLKTSLELKARLEKEGAKVKMTRTTDTYVKLNDRHLKGDVFLSVHNDALESRNANGATVYWYHEQQEGLAETLNASIQKKAMLSNRGARQENYQVLRQTEMPAVLLELGYISNPTDTIMMNDENHRKIVEEAIVDGLKTYFLS
ncbi:N-acetylmuramoyl-L-alanine amidase [Staphylococcus lutrae]|uniref:Cell wall amidase n=1 Tax=Staphylococcus lutrae TaxID=155085 RepID=A0AAC9WIH6_9STAP|nr:N-acetylmuramoyl-L-alanine amidase [Staphylococcus lutrae]ARJ49938.1 cell wall amidase [Staphylococcus lutrae]PNZ38869.1 cell wall amidase [Staphylococcus lutrae]